MCARVPKSYSGLSVLTRIFADNFYTFRAASSPISIMGDQQGQQQQQQHMQMDSNIVKLRGLPWNVTPKEILQFLEGVQVDKGENGVHLITSPRDGRPNGEAFVECATDGDVAKAFEYQNKNLGKRYIESE